MILTDFDAKKYERTIRAEGREEGREEEREEGIRILIQAYQELEIPRETIIKKCAEKYEIAEDKAEKYVDKYCS